ncbi:MAG: PKD domain-containing protein, partial [Planctomycetaceae bacterium]
EFEENDSFRAASYLGTLGQPLSVNDQTSSGDLSIETKGDRDYYSFDITEVGNLDVFLANDVAATGLSATMYWVDPGAEVEERAITNPRFVGQGGSSTLTASIDGSQAPETAIRQLHSYLTELDVNGNRVNPSARIVVEIQGEEASNIGGFVYGTAERYRLSIDAPGNGTNNFAGGGDTGSGGGSGSGSGGSGDLRLPGPPTADIEDIIPSPRSTGVPEVRIVFNEDVVNVDVTDFRLTLDGEQIDISDRTVVQIDPMTYTLDLSGVSQEEGQYRLLLRRSDITDLDNDGLSSNASETWLVNAEVSSSIDFIDSEVGDGQASDDDGNSSLRAAVQEANDVAGEDLIRLPAGTYTLSLDGHFESGSLFGDLNVTDDLRIVGDGAGVTVIDAAQVDRVFHVFPGVTLTLDGVTLANGEAHDGGAIFNEGTLNLIDSNIVGSRAFNQGGGIYNLGTVDLLNSSIVLNAAGSRGGGIFNAGEVSALNTTIAGNTAVSRGAGIFNDGEVDLNSVTLALNEGGARGAGIANGDAVDDDDLRLGNTLVAQNSSDFVSPVSGNIFAQDIDGNVQSRGNNLVSFLDTHVDRIAAGYRSTDLLGGTNEESPEIDAKLAQVRQANAADRNGTFRVNLKAQSPAIDAGNGNLFPDSASNRDQIDHPRFLDGDFDAERQIDIGAKERFVNRPVPFFTVSANPAGIDERITFDAILSSHTLPDFNIVEWEWDFDYDGTTFDVDASGQTVNRRFPAAGEFTVALRVTDNNVPPRTAITTQVVEIGVEPDQPVPVNITVTTDSTPILEWRGGAADFQLQLRRIEDDGSETLLIDESGIQSNQFTIPLAERLDPGERYVYRVRGRNGAGFGDWSEDEVFRVRQIQVRRPFRKEPDRTPEIQWTGVKDTLRYELFVKDTNANVEVYRISNLPGDSNRHELPDILPVGDYLVRVIAYDQNDLEGDKSPPRRFSIVAPVPVTPMGITVDPTPLIEWTKINTTFYEVEIRDRVTDNVVESKAGIRETSIEAASLADGDYYFRVRAVKAEGEVGHWSEESDFTVASNHSLVPTAPVGNIVNRLPEFSWEGVSGVENYQFIIDENVGTVDNPVWERVLRENDLTEPVYQPENSDRLDAGRYRWRVRWLNADGDRGQFTDQEFRVRRPVVTSPTDGETVNTSLPTFTWAGAGVMTSYEIRVDNVDLGINNVIREAGLTRTSFTPSEPLANWTFRVRVRGTDVDGNVSQWSEITLFTVDGTVGNAPLIRSPNGGALLQDPPLFTWDGVTSAFSYNLLIKEVRGSGQPLVVEVNGIPHNDNVVIQSHLLQENLPANRNFRWWVQAVNASGQLGPFSAPGNFRTSGNVSTPLMSGQNESSYVGQSDVVATLGEQITIHPALPASAPVDSQTATLKSLPVVTPTPEVAPGTVHAEPIAPAAEAADVDSVMTDWATQPVEMLETSADPAVSEVEADSGTVDERLLFAAGLPLLFGKKRKNRDKKNKKQ